MFQASILGELDIELVEKCLKHPSKEPEYRNGRNHSDFLSDLRTVFKTEFDPQKLAASLESRIRTEVLDRLGSRMTSAVLTHAESIKSRRE